MDNDVNNINIKKEQKINTVAIVLIIMFIVCSFGATYAWFAATVTNNNKVTANANCYTVNYTKGQDISGALFPGTSYTSGWSTGVVMYTAAGCQRLSGTLYITTNSSSTIDFSDGALKYAVLIGNKIVSEGKVDGTANQIIYNDFVLNETSTTYTVYIWLDSSVENATNLSSESFSGYIHADVKATSEISGSYDVLLLSSGTGKIKNGKNMTNLITNSSFENTGWNCASYNTTYKKYGSYSCALTGTTSSSEVTVTNNNAIALDSTHTYYSRVEIYQTALISGQSFQTYWPVAEPSFGTITFSHSANTWTIYSQIATRSSFSGTTSGKLRFDFNNVKGANVAYYDGSMLLDLTEIFGVGREPTKAWLDANIPYFSSSLSMKRDFAAANASLTYTIEGATPKSVSCTNSQKGTVSGTTITISSITSNTVCTVSY